MKIDGEKYTKEEVKWLLNSMKKRIKKLEEDASKLTIKLNIYKGKYSMLANEPSINDKLHSMFEMQTNLQKKMFGKLENGPEDSVEDFHYSITALISEIGEVLSADKRWKNARNAHYDRDEKLFELVDCMAFLVNAIQYSGFTVEEFYKAFAEKNQINLHRTEKE